MKQLQKLLRIILGVVFLFSAYTKFVGPGFFEITMLDQGLMPNRAWAQHAARFLIGFEFALGLLMILPYYTKQIMAVASLLLIGFTLHLSYLWAIGDTENCGCFGEMISMSPGESILKNAFMLIASGWLWKTSSAQGGNSKTLLIVSLFTVGSMWFLLPIPNQSEFPTTSFTNFEYTGRTDLAAGEKLIAVLNLDCEHCQELAVDLGDLWRGGTLPATYVLYFKEGDTTVEQFELLTNSQFPYAEIDVNTFFDLIGDSPPRMYHLVEGKIENVWDEDITENIELFFQPSMN